MLIAAGLMGSFLLGLFIGWLIWHARYCARCRNLYKLEDDFKAAVKKDAK